MEETENPTPMIFWIILYIWSISFLIKTAITNPGYIHKQVPPLAIGPLNSAPIHMVLQRDPKHKHVVIRGSNLRLSYCTSWFIYRPPRCSHCPDCDSWVERFDHHCPWVGNWVGKRNYKFFAGFLFFTTALVMWIIVVWSM